MSLDFDPATALDAVLDRVDATLDATGDAFPYFFDDDAGAWETTPDGNWCGGHWIGLLWLAAARRGDGRFERAARSHTATMRESMPRETMFRGMNFLYAGFRAYDASGDRSLFGLGLDGADAMVEAYHGGARQVPLGTLDVKGPEQFRGPESDRGPSGDRIGAVDNVYTALAVLWRAYRETGAERFRDTAVSHADRHLDWYLRPDGRTWHHAVFDPDTGALERRYNELAYSDDTCWARGQGWNVAGLARAYRETGAERYRAALERSVDYYREHSPPDGVPRWDFEVDDPDAPRDTSAAALAAYGLARLPADDERVADLREYGREILDALVADYLVVEGDRRGAVRHGCFNAPGGYATDNELLWTQYYVAATLDALA